MFVHNPNHKNLSSLIDYINAIDQEIKDEKFPSALTLCNDAVTSLTKKYVNPPTDSIEVILAKVKIINAMVNLKEKLEAKPKNSTHDTALFKRN